MGTTASAAKKLSDRVLKERDQCTRVQRKVRDSAFGEGPAAGRHRDGWSPEQVKALNQAYLLGQQFSTVLLDFQEIIRVSVALDTPLPDGIEECCNLAIRQLQTLCLTMVTLHELPPEHFVGLRGNEILVRLRPKFFEWLTSSPVRAEAVVAGLVVCDLVGLAAPVVAAGLFLGGAVVLTVTYLLSERTQHRLSLSREDFRELEQLFSRSQVRQPAAQQRVVEQAERRRQQKVSSRLQRYGSCFGCRRAIRGRAVWRNAMTDDCACEFICLHAHCFDLPNVVDHRCKTCKAADVTGQTAAVVDEETYASPRP